MITFLSVLFLGFFLGMRHATDSDHVVAVTTIVSRQRSIRGAALTGIFWGVGHSLTMLVAGGAVILLGVVVPERWGLSLELCVALMLVLLGAMNLRSMLQWLREGNYIPNHRHEHTGMVTSCGVLKPVAIGVVHGLAGSAALALLVLPMIHSPAWAMAYLLIFGAGTIAGMMLVTAAIALPITYAAARAPLFQRYVGATAGMFSVGFGVFLFWHIGFVEGLFTR